MCKILRSLGNMCGWPWILEHFNQDVQPFLWAVVWEGRESGMNKKIVEWRNGKTERGRNRKKINQSNKLKDKRKERLKGERRDDSTTIGKEIEKDYKNNSLKTPFFLCIKISEKAVSKNKRL